MKSIKKSVLIILSSIILTGCGNSNSTQATNDSKTSISTSTEDVEPSEDWSDKAKSLLTKYCGQVLPFPSGFEGEVNVSEIRDNDTGTTYLQIYNSSKELSIKDYYKDLENKGWTTIKDCSGNINQKASNGDEYYELTSISSDKNTGYGLTYYYSEMYKVSVIQCYNDRKVSVDDKSAWDEKQEEFFENVITIVPSKLKVGNDYDIYAPTEDIISIDDKYYQDLSKENVKILENDGWIFNQDLSNENNEYVLEKNSIYDTPIYAYIYYYSGNHITFSYYYDIKESNTWPSEFVSSFEKETGFKVPEFKRDKKIGKYYYYTKKGQYYIYALDSDDSIAKNYTDSMNNANAFYDSQYFWYTDWGETWFLKPQSTKDINNNDVFLINFSTLATPYDDISTSWPSEKANTFLTKNKMDGVSLPTIDLSSYSNALRINITNYDDVYSSSYEAVKEDPSYYDVSDENDEEEIKEAAMNLAKSNTKMTVRLSDSDEKGYEYLKSIFKNMGWARVNTSTYDYAYEDATGTVCLSLYKDHGITTITITYGNGNAHVPNFYFRETTISGEAGESYDLDLVSDLLTGTITYISSNNKVSVDDNGHVTLSEDMEEGEYATITASILVNNESNPRTCTCNIYIPKAYDIESSIYEVTKNYNEYYNLSETDETYAKPTKRNNELYTLVLYPSSITTVEDAKKFVTDTLIPRFDFNFDEWDDENLLVCDYFGDIDVEMEFKISLTSDNKIKIEVKSHNF